jgi:hypothetical protein
VLNLSLLARGFWRRLAPFYVVEDVLGRLPHAGPRTREASPRTGESQESQSQDPERDLEVRRENTQSSTRAGVDSKNKKFTMSQREERSSSEKMSQPPKILVEEELLEEAEVVSCSRQGVD